MTSIPHNVERVDVETTGQRILRAARLANVTREDARGLPRGALPPDLITVQRAAEMVGVKRSAVALGKRVLTDGAPELVEAVERDIISVSIARDIIDIVKDRAQQPAALERVLAANRHRPRGSALSPSTVLRGVQRRDASAQPRFSEIKQFERAVEMTETAAEVIKRTLRAARHDVRGGDFAETLREVRRTLSSAITALEKGRKVSDATDNE